MNIKPRPNHRAYLDVLRRMGPEGCLQKSFELTATARALFKEGLRPRHPDLPEPDLHRLYVEHLHPCSRRS